MILTIEHTFHLCRTAYWKLISINTLFLLHQTGIKISIYLLFLLLSLSLSPLSLSRSFSLSLTPYSLSLSLSLTPLSLSHCLLRCQCSPISLSHLLVERASIKKAKRIDLLLSSIARSNFTWKQLQYSKSFLFQMRKIRFNLNKKTMHKKIQKKAFAEYFVALIPFYYQLIWFQTS